MVTKHDLYAIGEEISIRCAAFGKHRAESLLRTLGRAQLPGRVENALLDFSIWCADTWPDHLVGQVVWGLCAFRGCRLLAPGSCRLLVRLGLMIEEVDRFGVSYPLTDTGLLLAEKYTKRLKQTEKNPL